MTTTKLKIPEMTASQSQKHVTFNEALLTLDNLVQLSVLDKDLTAAPGSPTTGDTYIVGNSATGSWLGKDAQVASYDGDGWIFFPPNDGWFCWVDDEAEIYFYNGSWSALGDVLGAGYLPLGGGTLTGNLVLEETTPSVRFGDTDVSGDTLIQTNGVNFQISVDYDNVDANSTFQVLIDGSTKLEVNEYGLGVGGTSADANNALSFYGTNVLMNSGSSINLKCNKSASGNDASMTFQQASSTYALMGLLGNNNFTLKVGTGFTTAMVVDESSGVADFPEGISLGGGNTLRDYAAGIFTPSLEIGGASTGITYVYQYGQYTRIGNTVILQVAITLSSKGALTGVITITGLPFTPNPLYYPGDIVPISGFSGLSGTLIVRPEPGPVLAMRQSTSIGASPLTDAELTDSANLRITLHHFI